MLAEQQQVELERLLESGQAPDGDSGPGPRLLAGSKSRPGASMSMISALRTTSCAWASRRRPRARLMSVPMLPSRRLLKNNCSGEVADRREEHGGESWPT